ncbi:MAG TPA: DUF4156 domain-containing protein [Burkholderiales bacterium]
MLPRRPLSLTHRMLVLLSAVAVAGGCSFVELTKEGEGVRIAKAEEVAACTGLGRTTASVAHEVGFIPMHPERVQENINLIARNSGANMGGDTIVPASGITDGRQTFEVYRCKR